MVVLDWILSDNVSSQISKTLFAMDRGIVVSEFSLQSLYYVHYGKYPWERYEPPYPPIYGLNSTITVLLREWFWH